MSIARSTRSECSDLLDHRSGGRPAHVNEPGVQPGVGRQLRVERGGQQSPLTGGDHPPVVEHGQRLGRRADSSNQWSAYENRVDWPVQTREKQIDLEAINLPSE